MLKPVAISASKSLDDFEQQVGAVPAADLDAFEQQVGATPASSHLDDFESQIGATPAETPPPAPISSSKDISQDEFSALGKKYGIDPEELRSLAPYYGAIPAPRSFGEAIEQGAKGAAGSLARGPLGIFGTPQFVYKELQNPKTRAALDELTARGQKQRGAISQLAEGVVGPGTFLKSGAGAAARVAEAAAIGGVTGLTSSQEGEEARGAAEGAAIGGSLGLGAEALGRVIQKLGTRLSKPEQEAAARTLSGHHADLEEGTTRVLQERKESNNVLQEAIEQKKPLEPEAARVVAKEQLDPETLAQALDPSSTEGALLRAQVEKTRPQEVEQLGMESAVQNQLAEDVLKAKTLDYAEALSGKRPKTLDDAHEAIEYYKSRQGAEAAAEKYRLLTEEQAASHYIQSEGVRGGREDQFGNRALNFLSDAQFVLRDIDQTMGTKIEPIHRQLNTDLNRMSLARHEGRKDLDQIFRQNKDIDKVLTDSPKLYHALDTGDVAGLSEKEVQAVSQFKQYFDRGIEYVNALVKSKDPAIAPLAIPRRENYVPHMLKNSPELIAAVDGKVAALEQAFQKPLQALDKRDWAELQLSQEGKDLLAGLKIFDANEPKNGKDLVAKIRDNFHSNTGRVRLDTQARAAIERTGEIPMFLRETNLYRLADRWNSNTLRHLYLRKSMDQLASQARRLEQAGAMLEAKYLNNLLADINGVRSGTAADLTRKVVTAWQSKLDRLAQDENRPAVKAALTVAKSIPELIGDLGRQIYPNLLGLNPKAMIQNAMQPFLKTAPELGNKYGYLATLKGTLSTIKNFKAQIEKVERLGLAPAEFTSQFQRAAAEGIRRSALYAIPSELAQKLGGVSLHLYSKLDNVNRAIALSVAENMARDLAKGVPLAQDAMKNFPTALRRQVGLASSEEEVAKMIAQHLNASTQYNYNRASMSEFGRTMGPLFSIFSKWPTATAGEILQEFRDKGALKGSLRNAEKYLYPLLMLKAGDYLLSNGEGPKEGFSDRQKKLFGATGMAQAAPIGSLEGIAKGDFFTPPAIDLLLQTAVLPTLEQDPEKFKKGMSNALQSFAPGSVYIRFLTDDLVTYLYGHRPQGSNFIERTQEGAHRLLK